jgi:DNA gyrase subunit A
VIVSITRGGYAKRVRTDQYRLQKRGGKGVAGATLRGDDVVDHLFATTAHHWILFFTTAGRVYRTKAYHLPESSRESKGGHVRAAQLPAGRADRAGADGPRLRAGALPRARDPQRLREEDRLPTTTAHGQAGLIAINFREETTS